MRIYLQVLLSFIPLLGVGTDRAHASPASALYIRQAIARYHPLPQDARSLSLAGSTALTCDDIACIYQNPAGLGYLGQSQLAGTVGYGRILGSSREDEENIEQRERKGQIQGAMPLGSAQDGRPEYGALALGLYRYQGITNDPITSTPDGHLRTGAYGYAPLSSLAVGYSFTFYDDQLITEDATLHSHARMLHVFGTQFRPGNEITLGGVFQLGIGQSDTLVESNQGNGLSHPRQYSGALGISKEWDPWTFSFSVDYSHLRSRGELPGATPEIIIGGTEEGDYFNVRLGTEVELQSGVVLRGGLRWYEVTSYEFKRPGLNNLSGGINDICVSVGAGYNFLKENGAPTRMRLDYGFEYTATGSGDLAQMIGLTLFLD